MKKDSKTAAVFYMIICAALWSTSGVFIKFLPWNPMVIVGIRSLISAGVYFLYMRYEKIEFRISRYSILGGISLMCSFMLFVTANKLTTSANAIVLNYSAPIFILILSALIYHQKFRAADIITVTVTSIGISLLFLDKLSGGYLLGNLLALASGIAFASMFVVTGHADDDSRSSGILLGHIFSSIVGIPFIFFSSTPVSVSIIAVIFAMGVFQLGIPYILYGLAVRKCTPLACSLISTVEPLLNPVWVFFYNREIPSFFALIGGAIVISSVATWSVWSIKAESPQTECRS